MLRMRLAIIALLLIYLSLTTVIPGQALEKKIDIQKVILKPGTAFFPMEDIQCLAVEEDRIWWGTSGGLMSYSLKSGELFQHTERAISQIIVGDSLWVAESPARILRFKKDEQSWENIEVPALMKNKEIRCLVEDEGYLWLGTNALPESSKGMLLYRFSTEEKRWEDFRNSDLARRQIEGMWLPDYDYANLIRVLDNHLLVFGEVGTYWFDKLREKWEEITSDRERQEAVKKAFTIDKIPFSCRIGPYGANSIETKRNLWLSSLGLPSTFSERISSFVLQKEIYWLGINSGLKRFERAKQVFIPVTTIDLAVIDMVMADATLWAAISQKGVLCVETDQNWAQFRPVSLADIVEKAEQVTIEGLVSIEDAYPKKELCLIEHWQLKKRSYYFIAGSKSPEIQKLLGKVIKVSGKAKLIYLYPWGGKVFILEAEKIIEAK